MYHNTIIFVLCDSITNSVFSSQCLLLLNNLQKKFSINKIIIVSFEKKIVTTQHIKTIIPHKYIVYIYRSFPFLGRIFLSHSIARLKTILKHYTSYTIIARGPLAGYIALRSFTKTTGNNLIIQARGLLAEEYAYTYRHDTKILRQPIHYIKKYLYNSLEQYVYNSTKKWHTDIVIEAVSPALKNHLIAHYGVNPYKICIAQYDLPNKINDSDRNQWRYTVRNKLAVPETAFVLCYSGSAKSWQCPQDIIRYAESYITQDPQTYLVIFTHDIEQFHNALAQSTIPQSRYRVLSIPCKKIYTYLAACDAGIVFRKPHVINWISRPTKSLEYQAVDLQIIHNNTVAYLLNKQPSRL